MKKNEIRSYSVLAIVFLVFTVISFVLPFDKTTVYWFGFIFAIVAIISQLFIIKIAFFKGDSVKSKFYGFPIARVGIIYLTIQICASLGEMALGSFIPFWVALIINVVVLAFAATGCIATSAMREELEIQDQKIIDETSMMKNLQLSATALKGKSNNVELEQLINKLSDTLRFSDPVSSIHTNNLENNLKNNLEQIRSLLSEENNKMAEDMLKNSITLLEERNRICAANKHK